MPPAAPLLQPAAQTIVNVDDAATGTLTITGAWAQGTSWQQLGADIDAEAAYDYFGQRFLSADGSTVAIGAWGNDENGFDSACAHLSARCHN